jgi:hypothetical protein
MSEPNAGIAADVDKVLESAKWPQGRSLEQSLADIEAVLKLMTAKLSRTSSSVYQAPLRSVRSTPECAAMR